MSSKHGIFFRIEINIPLVIQGLLASFFCFRLRRWSGACLSMILAIKFSNWSNVLIKLSRIKGKLFEVRLPNFLSRLSEKGSGQKFFYFCGEK